MMQLDESTFSPRKYNESTWAKAGRPLSVKARWPSGPVIAVMGAISATKGLVAAKYKENAFNGDDFYDFLKELRAEVDADKKIGLFLDNCGIHRSNLARDRCQALNILSLIHI